MRPAALRALGEAALPQARVYYDASLEYGRSTTPDSGLFYLGSARASAEAVELCRSLSRPGAPPSAPLRTLTGELEQLEDELLAAYRPPLSIERHADFIAASSALKEARELDAAGLRHGALLRYLQAAQRFAPLRAGAASDSAGLAGRLDAQETRLSVAGVDHSLGRLFLERARDALASSPPDEATAQAVASEVLPRYLAALQPARPAPPAPCRAPPSRWCAGPTPETCPTQQVCWPTASRNSTGRASWSRTSAAPSWRGASA